MGYNGGVGEGRQLNGTYVENPTTLLPAGQSEFWPQNIHLLAITFGNNSCELQIGQINKWVIALQPHFSLFLWPYRGEHSARAGWEPIIGAVCCNFGWSNNSQTKAGQKTASDWILQ